MVEGRAEPRTVNPLLYAPTTERRRAQRGTERSRVSSKNIFRSHSSDRLSSILINLIFSVLKNERGVRGEFHFSKYQLKTYDFFTVSLMCLPSNQKYVMYSKLKSIDKIITSTNNDIDKLYFNT